MLLDDGITIRKVHYMLHNIDMMIARIESRGDLAPANAKEFK